LDRFLVVRQLVRQIHKLWRNRPRDQSGRAYHSDNYKHDRQATGQSQPFEKRHGRRQHDRNKYGQSKRYENNASKIKRGYNDGGGNNAQQAVVFPM
jgi:hypothetical protein